MRTILACATIALAASSVAMSALAESISVNAFQIEIEDGWEHLNLPLTIPLTLQRWGDFSGYQHDYVEGASFLRLWWLANDSVVIFVAYKCGVEMQEHETEAIDAMVRSLSAE